MRTGLMRAASVVVVASMTLAACSSSDDAEPVATIAATTSVVSTTSTPPPAIVAVGETAVTSFAITGRTAQGGDMFAGTRSFSGELVGSSTFTGELGPGGVVAESEDEFTGTFVGAGDGTFTFRTAGPQQGTVNTSVGEIVAVSGVFEEMTGTLTLTLDATGAGTYEIRLAPSEEEHQD